MRLNLEFSRNLEEVLAHEVGGTQGTSRGYSRGRTLRTLRHRLLSETSALRVFIFQEGRSLFTVGAETLEGQPGQIIIVPPETPLRQIDIHASKRFITDWLEE